MRLHWLLRWFRPAAVVATMIHAPWACKPSLSATQIRLDSSVQFAGARIEPGVFTVTLDERRQLLVLSAANGTSSPAFCLPATPMPSKMRVSALGAQVLGSDDHNHHVLIVLSRPPADRWEADGEVIFSDANQDLSPADLFVERVASLRVQWAGDALSAQDVVDQIGLVASSPGGRTPMTLRARCPVIARAELGVYPEEDAQGGKPFTLELEAVPAARPTLGALRRRFGDYRRVPTYDEAPSVVAFQNAERGAGWNVVLYARIASGSDQRLDETARVSALEFRRDPVEARGQPRR